MTNKELAAKCLIEAAGLLDESAGKNGAYGRMLEEKYKAEKAKNDKKDNYRQDNYQSYKRAGYEDKLPLPANRDKENYNKSKLDDYNSKKKEYTNKLKLLQGYKDHKDYEDTRDYLIHRARKATNRSELNNRFGNISNNAKLHRRINNRTNNESIDLDALLDEAIELIID